MFGSTNDKYNCKLVNKNRKLIWLVKISDFEKVNSVLVSFVEPGTDAYESCTASRSDHVTEEFQKKSHGQVDLWVHVLK